MTLILGIDPGSRITGYGVIRTHGQRQEYITSGCIRTQSTAGLAGRLRDIFEGVSEIISEFQPQQLAIEKVFMARSADSALKLGQARGAAIVAAATLGLDVFEYEARKVKQAVVGTGAADKKQVQHMVRLLLKLPAEPQEDAADALAIALCHINSHSNLAKVDGVSGFRRGRMVNLGGQAAKQGKDS